MNFTGVRNNTGVSEAGLRKFVPSIFAENEHESRSERYTFLPTWTTLQKMQENGFVIVSAQQARVRDRSRRDFCKHMVRLRHTSDLGKSAVVGDSIFELILKNSHDGSSLYELMGGVFRFVCTNGMVVADSQMPTVKVRHQGDIADNVIDASYEVINHAPEIGRTINEWRQLTLNRDEQMILAEEAVKLRFDVESVGESPLSPSQMLTPRRVDDQKPTLWNTYNRLQENAIKGGLTGRTRDSRGRMQSRSVRAVKGIDQDVKLNKALWSIAAKMAELKGV